MIESKYLVTITPVGRKKYIELLYPYLLRDNYIIDQHIFWMTTDDYETTEYVKELCRRYPKYFAMQYQDADKMANAKYFLNDIYATHNAHDTVYVQIADDICWIDPVAIGTLAAFKINNPSYFLTSPLIVNTSITTSIHQSMNSLPLYLTGEWNWQDRHVLDLKRSDPVTAHAIHESFLRKLELEATKSLLIEKYQVKYDQFLPHQCFCWSGDDSLYFNRPYDLYESDFLSRIEPISKEKYSYICGGALVSHFSFTNQEAYLLKNTLVYNKYRDLSKALVETLDDRSLLYLYNKHNKQN